MKMSVVILLLILLQSPSVPDKNSVRIVEVQTENHVALAVLNENVFPVTVVLNASYKNLKPSKDLPLTTVLNASEHREVIRLTYTEANNNWNLNVKYSWQVGSVAAEPDRNFAYRLPFKKGSKFYLSQGYNGDFSHKGDQRYALDFVMKEGTAVYAARDGIVAMTEESNFEGGNSEIYNDKANFVSVLHIDGTFADYSHLRQNGVTVRVGQRVRAGQIIGFSGATGYVNGPHLHFVVKKAVKGGGFQSVPVKFTTRRGILDELEEGEFYTGY